MKKLGETGMGYTVVTVTLADGRVFPQAIIDSGNLSRVRGHANVPFAQDEIASIVQTDDKWDWAEKP